MCLFHKLRHLIEVEEVSLFAYSIEEYISLISARLRTLEYHGIEWSKARSCTDKASMLRSILKDEVPERDHPRKYATKSRITDHRTSSAIGDPLDDESETRFFT